MTTTDTDARTDVDAAAELAAMPVILGLDGQDADEAIEVGGRYGVALPPGWRWDTFDEERDLDRPRRAYGTVSVFDGASFVKAVERLADTPAEVTIYADEDTLGLTAVLNDDVAGGPAWRDHRVTVALRPTPEWTHWLGLDGKLVSQETFAEHIEDGVNELRTPDASTMLNIAQTFHATTNANVKSAIRLADGRVQLVYEEEVDATAGDGVAIPDVLVLAIKPFVGGPAYEMTARFRYRLTRGAGLTMGYKLDRPHEVKRAAYLGIVAEVEAGLPTAAHLAGKAPEAR